LELSKPSKYLREANLLLFKVFKGKDKGIENQINKIFDERESENRFIHRYKSIAYSVSLPFKTKGEPKNKYFFDSKYENSLLEAENYRDIQILKWIKEKKAKLSHYNL
jgi:hypothetical protein